MSAGFVVTLIVCALTFHAEAGPTKARETQSVDTQWDKPLTYECPSGHVISYVRSTQDNGTEDPVFAFECRASSFVSRDSCRWSGYLNMGDRPINYRCPGEGAIVAMASQHDNHREDPRYNVKCCPLKTGANVLCSVNPSSGYLNNWDGVFTLNITENGHINGIHCINHKKKDRMFRFDVCRPQ